MDPGASVNHGTKLDGVGINPILASAIPPLRPDCQIAFLGSMVPWLRPGSENWPKTRVGLSRNPVRVSSTSLSMF